jgi:hypothetical protein
MTSRGYFHMFPEMPILILLFRVELLAGEMNVFFLEIIGTRDYSSTVHPVLFTLLLNSILPQVAISMFMPGMILEAIIPVDL